MNAPQRASRKALIGQVSSLLAKKKKFPGRTGPNLIPAKPTGEIPRQLGGPLTGERKTIPARPGLSLRPAPANVAQRFKKKSGMGARYLGS